MTERLRRPQSAAPQPSNNIGPGPHASALAALARQGCGDKSVVRHPSSVIATAAENLNAALEYEIAREKAASLGRLGRRLEAALEALRAFDASHARAHSPEREALLEEAGVLLWSFVVQREACGLRDSTRIMQDYG